MEQIYLFLDSNPLISIIFFAILQLWVFIPTLRKLSKFKNFFPDSQKWEVEKGEIGYSIMIGNSSNKLNELVNEINEYLAKNEGTTDFGIIKDKVQNRLEALYEDATSKVSFPTYLGLMGTFFGVWIGLQSFKIGVDKAGVSDEIVSALIGGVIVSMVTSLIGLVLMMWGNATAASVLKKVEEDKNIFFDFIQVKLMPVMGTSMVSALNKLHRTINTFEPAFRGIIGEFKTVFSDCTESLRGAFGEKVQLLASAVETMGNNMSLVNENVRNQETLLRTLRQRDTLNTLESFTRAADRFESVITSINQLSDVKERIIESTTQLVAAQTHFIEQLVIPERVFEKINTIFNRISTFEESINALGESIAQTQLFGNRQMNLIEEQITAIQRKTELAVQYQEMSDSELESVYQLQLNAINQLNRRYIAAIESHGDNFEAAMNDFKTGYERIVNECKNAVEAKREEFLTEIQNSLELEAKNRYLANLDQIPEIVSLLSSIQKTEIKPTSNHASTFTSASNTSTNLPQSLLEQIKTRNEYISTYRTKEEIHNKEEIIHKKEEEKNSKEESTTEKKSWLSKFPWFN